MAFEAFIAHTKEKPRAGRLLALVASVVGHSALVLGAAALFLPPAVKAVLPTFVPVKLRLPSAPRPAPPAPQAVAEASPPANRPAVASATAVPRPPKRRPRPVPAPAAPPVAPAMAPSAPAEPPTAEASAAVTAPPTAPPVAAATPAPPTTAGGSPGAAGPPVRRPRFLPEALGASQKLSGDLPRLPPALARSGDSYTVLARVCVAESGQVSSVSIERPAHPALDGHVASTLRTWRYRPLMAANLPIPFCTFVRFEFRSL
jgi:periplasmic protein TonB